MQRCPNNPRCKLVAAGTRVTWWRLFPTRAHSCRSSWWCPLPAHHGGWDKDAAAPFPPRMATETTVGPTRLQHHSCLVTSLSRAASPGPCGRPLAMCLSSRAEGRPLSYSTLLLRLPCESLPSLGQIWLRGPTSVSWMCFHTES